jgi:hypothetical protein
LPAFVKIDPLHEAVPQLVVVGAFAQLPFPSQRPVNPQGGLGVQPPCGSIASAMIGLHMPAMPATLHDRQFPQLAEAQQTPSVHWPLSHSAPPAHSWPSRLRPQDPALQTFPGAQSPSPPHAAWQVVPLQAYAPQDCVTGARQVPAPSQVRASVAVVPDIGQVGGAHWVPAAYSWQLPAPSQKPVFPQVVAPSAVHCPFGSMPSAGTGLQVPGVPPSAHDMQLPVQAVVQQTPWAQNPLWQSLPAAQLAAGGRRPHEPLLQMLGVAQSASAAQVDLQARVPHLNG